MADLHPWWPAVVAGGAFLVVVILYFDLGRRERAARRHSPFAEEFLKVPGRGLRPGVEAASRRMMGALFFAGAWPLLVFGAWAGVHWLGGVPRSPLVDLAVGGILVLGWILGLYRLVSAEARYRRMRTALDAEIATGEMLAGLGGAGCRVLHDVPAPTGRISHVVISPAAVFAIRTFSRARARRGRGKEDVTAFVTGDELKFPGSKDITAVPIARKSAMSLGETLKSRLGLSVDVRPVVFLPGWYVENRVASDVQVLNPREARRLAAGAPVLGPERIGEIAAAIEKATGEEGPKVKPPSKPRPPEIPRKEPTL
jgi:hypothetical protein